ncbi:MAG: hypothetical protein P1U50_00945 [Parvibaculaceae bacterium]|nr:hypothetical protein [Parvibaculaceae bacterium]
MTDITSKTNIELTRLVGELSARLEAVENNQGKEVKPESEAVDKPWPQVEDEYFCAYPDGEITVYTWLNNDFNKDIQERGNLYRTREEAEKADQLCLAMNEFRAAAKKAWDEQKDAIDWTRSGQEKYTPVWCYIFEKWCSPAEAKTSKPPFAVYFPTRDSAIEAAKAVDAKYPGVLR